MSKDAVVVWAVTMLAYVVGCIRGYFGGYRAARDEQKDRAINGGGSED